MKKTLHVAVGTCFEKYKGNWHIFPYMPYPHLICAL